MQQRGSRRGGEGRGREEGEGEREGKGKGMLLNGSVPYYVGKADAGTRVVVNQAVIGIIKFVLIVWMVSSPCLSVPHFSMDIII